MSQDSTSSLEVMSQETREALHVLLGNEKSVEQSDFFAKYRINPFDVHLAEDNAQDNVQINIERLFSFPNIKPEMIDFSDSPPELNCITSASYASPPKTCDMQQTRPIIAPTVFPDATPSRHCHVPPNTDFPGSYQFDIGFQEEKGQPVKSAPWTYSQQLEKLFIQMRNLVPIRFIYRGCPPLGSYVKCVVVYKQPEHFREVVERCINHMTKHKDGHPAPKHLLRCENESTKYQTCQFTGRHSITIPVREFEVGVNYFTEMIQFMCFNSCPGGLNRRPINVIFSLENNGQVIGRKILESRICACPGRDRGNEEMAENKKKVPNASTTSNTQTSHPHPDQVISSCHETPPATPVEDHTNHVTISEEPKDDNRPSLKRSATKITDGFQLHSLSAYKRIKREEDELFTIQIQGREKYELLLKIKEGIDLMDLVPQSFLDSYRAGCPPFGPNWFIENQNKSNEETQKTQENIPNSQNSDSDGTPPSTFPLSQLSRTSSNTSSQGSNHDKEYSTVRFTLKRTVSLERKGLKRKEMEENEKRDK